MYCDRIDLNKGIDPAKSNNSKECIVCHYWFYKHEFEFQDSVYNGYHDLTILCVSISGIAMIITKGVHYYHIIHDICKSEAIRWIENYVLNDLEFI